MKCLGWTQKLLKYHWSIFVVCVHTQNTLSTETSVIDNIDSISTADASSEYATKTVNELGPVAVGPFPTFGGHTLEGGTFFKNT